MRSLLLAAACAAALFASAGSALAQYAKPSTPTTSSPTFPIDPVTGAATGGGGVSRSLNVTAATNIKASPGRVFRVILNTAGSTASSIIDSTGTSVTAANTILTIPTTATAGTVFYLDWPCTAGISVVPGTSAVIAISYE